MSAAPDALASRVRLSDPKPAYCSGCAQGAQEGVRFVDMNAFHDGGMFVREDGAILEGQDDLHLCEPCVRAAAEALGLKPELHAKQVREIRRLEADRDRWQSYAKKIERTLEQRPERPGR